METKVQKSFDEILSTLKNLQFDNLEETYKAFNQLTTNNLTSEEIDKILTKPDENRKTILHIAAEKANSEQIFKFVFLEIENSLSDDEKLNEILMHRDSSQNYPLLVSVETKNENSFRYLLENVYFEIFVVHVNINAFRHAFKYFFYKIFKSGTDSMLKHTLDTFKRLLGDEFGNFLKEYRSTIINAAFDGPDESKLKICLDFYKNNLDNETLFKNFLAVGPLINLIENEAKKLENVSRFWEIFQSYFSHFQVAKLLEEENNSGCNFFQEAAGSLKSEEMLKFWWDEIQKIFNEPEDLKKYIQAKNRYNYFALSIAALNGNKISFVFLLNEVYNKTLKLSDWIFEKNYYGQNLFYELARYASDSIVKLALEGIKPHLSEEDYKKLLKSKSTHGCNLLHTGTYRMTVESVQFFFDLMKSELSHEELKELLNEKDDDNDLALHCPLKCGSVEKFERTFLYYEKICTESEIQKILRIKLRFCSESFDKNILEIARYIDNHEDNDLDTQITGAVESILERFDVNFR